MLTETWHVFVSSTPWMWTGRWYNPKACVGVVLVQAYDVGVARAVAELRVLAELCLPFVRPGGVWVAAKGANPEVSPQLPCLCMCSTIHSTADEGIPDAVSVVMSSSCSA